jgi:hypothetical protein
MTRDEAARPEPDTDGRAPAAPARRDERPRPQYGEYAPEGWSWQPPVEADASGGTPPAAAPPAAPAPTAHTAPQADGAAEPSVRQAQDGARRGPTWDRILTIALLTLGAFGAWDSARSMQQLGQQVQAAYTMLGIGDFTAPEWLPALSVAGIVVQLSLYAVILGLAILRLRARRIAFWIPLAGGVLSVIVTGTGLAVIVFSDPTYLDFVTSQVPPPTTAP